MSSKTNMSKGSKNTGGLTQETSIESGQSLQQEQATVQKLQHLQAALKHLQTNREKERHERQTLSTLFQEEKDHKDKLLQLNKKFTQTIQLLKKRLEDNGLSSALDGNEATRPQTSKQLLADLMKENAELKQQLTECSNYNKPLKETQLQRIHDLEHKLEKECYEKRILEDRVKTIGARSDDEKDSQILRLEQEKQEIEENIKVQEVLSMSLLEEVVEVNKRLQATAKIYQSVVTKLKGENKGRSTDIDEDLQSLESLEVRFPKKREKTPPQDVDLVEGLEAEKTENNKLKSENIKLKSDLNEAIEVNKRWNSYNQQREVYVKKQQEEISLQSKRLARLQEPNGSEEDKKGLIAELERLKAEYSKACRTVDNLKGKNQILTTQNKTYQTRNRELMQSMENSPWYRELKDTVLHLQEQLHSATEDFQNERRDREKAQGRIADLELELAYFKRYEHAGEHYGGAVDLRSLEKPEKKLGYTAPGRCQPGFNVQMQQRPLLVAHSPGSSNNGDNDSLQTNPDGYRAGLDLAQALSQGQSQELVCPRCNKRFPSNEHQALLEHMDTCCE